MARRRMFSKDVIEHDGFLDMPLSTQALYFHLGLQADDDGFCTPKKVMRLIGSTDDDLRLLIGKKFVIPFESGVIVVTHWKANNYIQKDRYTPTRYLDEASKLFMDENEYYTLEKTIYPLCIHSGYTGKDRVGKERKGIPYKEDRTKEVKENVFENMSDEEIEKQVLEMKI